MRLSLLFFISVFSLLACNQESSIDRKAVVDRHKIVTTEIDTISPAQVGNGKFAFGVDITGLQTFVPFNTMSDWGWHSFPIPEGMSADDFEETIIETHGRKVGYCVPNPEQPELSSWLAGNPHRINLGRIGFVLLNNDMTEVKVSDLDNTKQTVDLWTGIIESEFILDGEKVFVETVCHSENDLIGVRVKSTLLNKKRIQIFFEFPYAENGNMVQYVGTYENREKHNSSLKENSQSSVSIKREMDDLIYYADIAWESNAIFNSDATNEHRFTLIASDSDELTFSCQFRPETDHTRAEETFLSISNASQSGWEKYWLSGAAVDLSESKDSRWKELERRVVLSQYLMRLNEAGLYPPQEAGLVNNGWYGRFHFEMIWWHAVHYGLWNRWELADGYLDIYRNFLPTSIERAKKHGYKGARWPKCTADFDRDWPHRIHATLIWQQPHPIYFAEMEYRQSPTQETLDKWKDVVLETAEFMADYAFYVPKKEAYVLGPPLEIVSENTDWMITQNPTFELAYWRYGLRVAQEWNKRLSMPENDKWKDVLENLSPLPVEDGLYVTYEGINDMWKNYTFEHPALTGVYGMLPGDGVDLDIYYRTFDKVLETWNLKHTWGWDFPMMAMGAAKIGKFDTAIGLLVNPEKEFGFDVHGLATGGPYPYFPANGGLLTAVAMMCIGWDGAEGDAPGFPKDGNWTVKHEGFVRMQ